MKKISFVILLLIVVSCQLNWYGDIDLGGDYYYLVEPAFNSINVPVNPDEQYVSSNYVIKNVEQIGFDKENILVISVLDNEYAFWWIDKTRESKKNGFDDNSILRMSNLHQIDSIKFVELKNETGIKMKTKTFYRKKLKYE